MAIKIEKFLSITMLMVGSVLLFVSVVTLEDTSIVLISSGFFPRLSSGLLMIFSGFNIYKITRLKKTSVTSDRRLGVDYIYGILRGGIFLVLYYYLLRLVGFYLAALVFLPVFIKIGGINSISKIMLASLCYIAIVYLLFNTLGTTFPVGTIFRY